MSNTLTIARRELNSFFFSPIAYVVLGAFSLLSGLMFMLTVLGGPMREASLRPLFFWLVWILIAIVPAISMRLLAEETRSGTIEPLMTSPVTDAQVILGKWLGGLAFFAVLLAPTLLYVILLEIWGEPDFGPLFTGYLGLLLVGALYMAIGAFASVMTRNQIIAFLLTVFIILMLTVVPYFLAEPVSALGDGPLLAGGGAYLAAILVVAVVALLAAGLTYAAERGRALWMLIGLAVLAVGAIVVLLLALLEPTGWTEALYYINVNEQFDDFSKGVLTSRNFVYFITVIALFLVLAVKGLETRKWR